MTRKNFSRHARDTLFLLVVKFIRTGVYAYEFDARQFSIKGSLNGSRTKNSSECDEASINTRNKCSRHKQRCCTLLGFFLLESLPAPPSDSRESPSSQEEEDEKAKVFDEALHASSLPANSYNIVEPNLHKKLIRVSKQQRRHHLTREKPARARVRVIAAVRTPTIITWMT
ncbi:uncharacterized protein LOC114877649 [Osmia bicornis bicornis]|uniref:uncharacterized protein LOC114877649 n=1 Tax=Osmia bicornis bicornis TaxID=1437191 RepID=UPI001EAF2BF2|nr:uncharacterized protein LOC114877649 [Osmia bicornis bicornis]